jgi:hypothetical protein
VCHSGGKLLGAGDMTFGVCVPSPPQTECSCSHYHLCAGVHEWCVADMVPSCLSVCSVHCMLCAVHGTIVPLLVKLHRLVVPGMHRFVRCGERCPSAFNSFELPSCMLYQDVQLLWDSGLVRGESGYSL